MTAAIIVLVTWLIFGGLHLLLTRSWIRPRLIQQFGEKTYIVGYTLLAAIALTAMIVVTARFGDQGIAGINLGQYPIARWLLGAIAFIGAGLSGAGLIGYSNSAVARLNRRARKAAMAAPQSAAPSALPISALERVSRHPFFTGFALLMGAHALLASHLAGAVFFGGFAVLSLLGIAIQDRKLLTQHPQAYAEHMKNTGYLGGTASKPGGVTGDASRSARSWLAVAGPALIQVGLTAAVLLILHRLWLIGYGAPFTSLLVIGALIAVASQIKAGSKSISESTSEQ